MKNLYLPVLATTVAAIGSLLCNTNSSRAAETPPADGKDTLFIQKAAQSSMDEVKMAKQGAQKAGSADLRTFAEMLVRDHSKVNEQLKELAATKGVKLDVELATVADAPGKKMDEESVAEFDKKFLTTIIKSHKKEVNAYQDASEDSKDVDVKAFAAKTLPVLKGHLSKARELNGEGDDASPDNTRVNLRDRDDKEVTPFDQGSSEADIQRTTQIRREVVALDTVSGTAKNIKIITRDGHVTLRGPVDDANEKEIIRAIATRVAGDEHLTDLLEVKSDDK